MGKIIESKIDRFDGGITNDPRDRAENTARFISNFDILSFPRKLVPYRNTEAGDDSASTVRKRNFAVALRTGLTYSVYGLGVLAGEVYAGVEYKNLSADVGGMSDNTWTIPDGGNSGSGTPNFNLWVYYRKTGLIYGARDANNASPYAGTHFFAFSPGGTAWDDTSNAITHTDVGQGVVHSKDDILYVPWYNNAGGAGTKSGIAKKDGSNAWANTALALPDHLIPTSICEYGNFLAIGCAPASGIGNSRIFLWNRNEALTTLSESIDAGSGSLIIIEQVDGELIWISQKGGANQFSTYNVGFSTLPNITTSHRDRVYFRRLAGNVGVKFFELHADRAGGINTTSLLPYKQLIDNRLFFQMIINYNGSVRDGVWSIGRSSPSAPFVLVNEQKAENNTPLETGDTLCGFIKIGDFLLQSYNDGGTYELSKTVVSSDNNYSENSIYESKTFDGSQAGIDASHYKDLKEVSVTTEYMVANGRIRLYYQVDEDIGTSTWTEIFDNTTNNSIGHTANNIESSGAVLPKGYKQIAFRIISTGDAQPTALIFKEDDLGKKFIAD